MAPARCPAAFVALVLGLGVRAAEARLKGQPGEGEAPAEATPPPLCAEALVAETCALLGDGPSATPSAVAELLAATPKAVAGLWAAAELREGAAVQCDALCRGTTALLWRLGRTVPPTSDTGCYDQGGGKTVCDLDLSPTAIRKIAEASKGDFAFGKDVDGSGVQELEGNASSKEQEDDDDPRVFEYDVEDIAVRVAELFRIYPALDRGVAIDDDVNGEDLPMAKGKGTLSVALLRRRLQQSRTYVGLSIRTMPSSGTRTSVAMYFGDDATKDGKSRRRILSVLNSISNVLGYAAFHGQGNRCRSGVFGYVLPCRGHRLERDSSGRFNIFLCSAFWTTRDEQICTLVHEASHHRSACTKDIQYGAAACRSLAQSKPRHALWNADNYGYYIREVASRRGVN